MNLLSCIPVNRILVRVCLNPQFFETIRAQRMLNMTWNKLPNIIDNGCQNPLIIINEPRNVQLVSNDRFVRICSSHPRSCIVYPRQVLFAPFSHVTGSLTMISGFVQGFTSYIMIRFDFEKFLATIQQYQVCSMSLWEELIWNIWVNLPLVTYISILTLSLCQHTRDLVKWNEFVVPGRMFKYQLLW